MVKIYREHNPKIRLAEDVKSLLIKLRGIYSLGIITDGYYEVQKKKVQALRLEELFDSIIFIQINMEQNIGNLMSLVISLL